MLISFNNELFQTKKDACLVYGITYDRVKGLIRRRQDKGVKPYFRGDTRVLYLTSRQYRR